jgi:hypothetical protein
MVVSMVGLMFKTIYLGDFTDLVWSWGQMSSLAKLIVFEEQDPWAEKQDEWVKAAGD